jgi:class 3 adenylate cyclase/predicted ATPase
MPTSYVEKLMASKGKMEGERRVVTILFSDVKGSTSLAENLDPEEVLEVMNGAFNVLIEPITRYEGTLARLMGDAILAFFGAPIAHEDDPYRACRAALDILEGARKYSRKLELEKGIKGFGVRVGINTGLVVVAEVGTDLRVEYTAMGDAVNIAARMESAAEPGTILITEATSKLVQKDFELSLVGPIKVKGKSDPINTYRVRDIKRDGFIPENQKHYSPLIGREKELIKIQESINQLNEGVGKIISIIGDGGIGKSRLVAELRQKKPHGIKWAEGRALTYSLNNSYHMFRCIFKNYLGFHHESLDESMFEILHNRVASYFENNIEEIYPFIEHFLKSNDGSDSTKNIFSDDLRALKGQFHYSLKELLKRESLHQPVLFVWEDLQWCDFPSLELLNDLLSLTLDMPVLFLLQYRLDENEKRAWNFHHNNLKEYNEKHEIISLHPLDEKESLSFIRNLIGSNNLPLDIQNQVIEKTDGNPAFLEEVTNSIIESSSKQVNKSSQNSNYGRKIEVPSMLQNVIMARVDGLEPLDKTTLQTASVIGRVFQKNLLSSMVKNELTDDEFEKSLNELQQKEFILRHLPANITSTKSILQKEYIFKQEITQDVVYNSLLLSQRQNLHRQIGELIENLHSDNIGEFVGTLAIHFEKGKDLKKAFYYYKIAAERAKDLFANEDAIILYSKALELSDQTSSELVDLAKIYDSMGDVYSLKAEYSKAIDHFNLSSKYYKDSSSLAKIHFKCGKVFELWGNYEKALENYNAGLIIVNEKDSNILVAHIYTGMGMVCYRQGDLFQAEKLNERALEILRKINDESTIASVYNNLGIIFCKLGELEKSLDYHNKSLQIREKLGSTSGLAASHNNLGYHYQLNNDLEKAIKYYEKSLEYCERMGNQHGLARTFDNLSHIYIKLGNQEMAMEYNLRAISILGKIAKEETNINADVWLQSGVW